jgi:MerR family transcriptional regulator, redox-sensitive transcriptional activator SoxR
MSRAVDRADLTIGQVAALAGVRASAIRYYEQIGVLPAPERVGGQRRYSADVVQRLAIIRVAQRAGFTLEEIRELLGAAPAGDGVRAFAERKLPAIEDLIDRARAVRAWLEAASRCECPTLEVCDLFDERALAA